MDALFTAFDVAALSTKVSVLAIAGIGVQLIYVGWKHIRKGGNRV